MERQAPHAYPCASPLQIIEPTSVARSTTTSGESNTHRPLRSYPPGTIAIGTNPSLRASRQSPNLEKEEVNRLPAIAGAVNRMRP